MMTRGAHRETGRWLVLSASLLVSAACSDATDTNDGSTPTEAASTSTPASSTDPGVRTIDGQVIGVGDYPAFTLEVPATWSVGGAS